MGCLTVKEEKFRVVSVCGVKNSGKTTLLTRLVKELTERGIKVAVIKHDGHDFICDAEGSDTDRLKKAGVWDGDIFGLSYSRSQDGNERERKRIVWNVSGGRSYLFRRDEGQ